MRAERLRVRRRHIAAAGLVLAAGLATVAVRAVGPTIDRLAWAASLDPSASAEGEVVRQQNRTDCGPAALKMVLDHWGVGDSTLAELEAATGTGPDGTSLLAIKRAAERRGVTSQGFHLPIDRLGEIPLPAIAHVHGDHFVVIRTAGDELVVDDPSIGRLRMSPRTFDRSWDGIVLAFTGGPSPISRTAGTPSVSPQPTTPEGANPQ